MFKISIVTPSFNQGKFLEDAIVSVISQEDITLEYIIMDGGSSDNSPDIIKKYQDHLYYWRSEKDGGQANAINQGWSMSSGEILGWLNSDDLYCKGTFRVVSEAFEANPSVKVIFGDCSIINYNGDLVKIFCSQDLNSHQLLLGSSLPQPSVFIHRSVVEEIGFLDASLHYALDWAYFLKVFCYLSPESTMYLPKVLSMARHYDGTKSRTGLIKKGNERRKVLQEYFDKNVLDEVSLSLQKRAIAGTYRVQCIDTFLAGMYFESVSSAFKAIYFSPSLILEKFLRIDWLINERRRRLNE